MYTDAQIKTEDLAAPPENKMPQDITKDSLPDGKVPTTEKKEIKPFRRSMFRPKPNIKFIRNKQPILNARLPQDKTETSHANGNLDSSADDVKPIPADDVKPIPADDVKSIPAGDVKLIPTNDIKLIPADDVKLIPINDVKLIPANDIKQETPKNLESINPSDQSGNNHPVCKSESVDQPITISNSTSNEEKSKNQPPRRFRMAKPQPNLSLLNKRPTPSIASHDSTQTDNNHMALKNLEKEVTCDSSPGIVVTSSMSEKHNDMPCLTSLLKSPKKRIDNRDVGNRRKKYVKGDNPPEKSKMTMMDLIYWNPSTSPMKGGPKKKVSTEIPLPPLSNEEIVDSPVIEETPNVAVPRLTVGENGEIIIDEASLVISRTAPEVDIAATEVVYEENTTTYSSFRKNTPRKIWSRKEMIKFYKALSIVGTDFSLMTKFIPERSRKELKLKFKKEEKVNTELINKVVFKHQKFDPGIFDDYKDLSEGDDDVKVKKEKKKRGRKKKNCENHENESPGVNPVPQSRKRVQRKKKSIVEREAMPELSNLPADFENPPLKGKRRTRRRPRFFSDYIVSSDSSDEKSHGENDCDKTKAPGKQTVKLQKQKRENSMVHIGSDSSNEDQRKTGATPTKHGQQLENGNDSAVMRENIMCNLILNEDENLRIVSNVTMPLNGVQEERSSESIDSRDVTRKEMTDNQCSLDKENDIIIQNQQDEQLGLTIKKEKLDNWYSTSCVEGDAHVISSYVSTNCISQESTQVENLVTSPIASEMSNSRTLSKPTADSAQINDLSDNEIEDKTSTIHQDSDPDFKPNVKSKTIIAKRRKSQRVEVQDIQLTTKHLKKQAEASKKKPVCKRASKSKKSNDNPIDQDLKVIEAPTEDVEFVPDFIACEEEVESDVPRKRKRKCKSYEQSPVSIEKTFQPSSSNYTPAEEIPTYDVSLIPQIVHEECLEHSDTGTYTVLQNMRADFNETNWTPIEPEMDESVQSTMNSPLRTVKSSSTPSLRVVTPQLPLRTTQNPKVDTPSCEPPNLLLSSLGTPVVTPKRPSSQNKGLLTTLSVSNSRTFTIPTTPGHSEQPDSLLVFAKTPEDRNTVHVFTYNQSNDDDLSNYFHNVTNDE